MVLDGRSYWAMVSFHGTLLANGGRMTLTMTNRSHVSWPTATLKREIVTLKLSDFDQCRSQPNLGSSVLLWDSRKKNSSYCKIRAHLPAQ